MKKTYLIRDMVQTNEQGKPLYWYGYYTNKHWTTFDDNPKEFDSIEEAEHVIVNIIAEEGGYYTIENLYS